MRLFRPGRRPEIVTAPDRPAPARVNYDTGPFATTRYAEIRDMYAADRRTATVPRSVANRLEVFLTVAQHDDDAMEVLDRHHLGGVQAAALRQALSDAIEASDMAYDRNGGSEMIQVSSIEPPAVLYDRDDVDEATIGQLAVLAQVRRMVVDYHPATADPLADVLAIIDVMALSLAPDDDDPDTDGT